MTQHFLARKLAISFAYSKLFMKPKESVECNQTLSWTDRWGGQVGSGYETKCSQAFLCVTRISMNANSGVKHKGLKQLRLQAMIMSAVTTNYL